jgi:hypothetical protein
MLGAAWPWRTCAGTLDWQRQQGTKNVLPLHDGSPASLAARLGTERGNPLGRPHVNHILTCRALVFHTSKAAAHVEPSLFEHPFAGVALERYVAVH